MEKNQGPQDRAKREALREYIRDKFIEEYHRQDMNENERAWRIGNVDRMVDVFLAYADRTQIVPTDDGIVFVTDGEATFIPGDELDG